jgi:hypothetical protein
MRAALLATIDGVADQALSEPTLDGWSVKDHLAHIALWDEIRVAEVLRISAGFDSVWKTNGVGDDVYNELGHRLRSGLSLAQVKWELADTQARLLSAIEQASERGLDGSLYGEAGLRSNHEAQHTGWIRRWRAERAL